MSNPKSLGLLRQMPGVLKGMIDAGKVVYAEHLPITDNESGVKEPFMLVIARGTAKEALEKFAHLLVDKVNEKSDEDETNIRNN